jgi:hypothetical protein
MNPVDAANNVLSGMPQDDSKAIMRTLKDAQAVLDEGRVAYPRLLWISQRTYQTLVAAGAKFLEKPAPATTCGIVYGFAIIVEGENNSPRCQSF